ncbi:hypothetical protein COW36_04660 [bacterium (Candidatus Blackallbacteria) CG17_big_fil_post_rev_8_21_14_2_50_48_46]|uniref:DUF3048 domain-containing protein n=1 Tax=bacterium (Candidatus Blackallbacteria) CG17_big_fil_post_rev_8_21_14_2_50_48_46 TaxID=2014261 RepID=A0A2M7G8Z5_9BACT|nr:MAG: hypothetical protein COW64_04285 [bacterium (Candidatus Blackallbacteria) CG18_big_fil_WC_8_21_14_2_50_49_26]PIW18586.1 MAG: hypothetical protein COW36_04660 [bacterium (Candidatus Blackallbacteria) CG17_big_fil_post_rev_8_21_14_2_50_48_46]PIW46428.1 MAG: hypothetical protein COW20_16020 [bacterium (Candidatus Blackallbacteria) CG13_big_fil_rev_8_21_14_2_50_49_14]
MGRARPLLKLLISAALLSSCGRVPSLPAVPQPQPSAPTETPAPLPDLDLPLPDLPFYPPGSQAMEKIYAPIVILDSREPSPLTSVEAHMRVGVSLQGDFSKKSITVEPLVQGPELSKYAQPVLNRFGQDYLLFLNARRQRAAFQNTVYVNKTENGAFTYLQYWFFYSYNDTKMLGGPPGGIVQKCGNHEADWEHMSLRINTQIFQKARTEQDYLNAIDDIYLSQHTRFQHLDRKWFRQGQLAFQGTHVQVYPANGSHATYPRPGRYFMQNLAGFKTYDINDGLGQKIDTSQGNLANIREQPWFSYGGRWGAINHDVCNLVEAVSPASNDGPYGPGHGDQPYWFYQSDWYGVNRPVVTPVNG